MPLTLFNFLFNLIVLEIIFGIGDWNHCNYPQIGKEDLLALW